MPWRLPSTLSYAKCGEQAVFLDLAANRYFVLSADHTRTLELALSGATCASLPVVAAFERRGIIERVGEGAAAPKDIVPPAEEFDEKGRASTAGLIRAALAWRAARRDLRTSSLMQLRDRVAVLREEFRNSTSDLASLAADFRRFSRLVSVQDRCLPAAMAFVRTARRGGHRADLVFGVRLNPFQAHCWAQAGSLVLNDRLDVVRAFTPVASW